MHTANLSGGKSLYLPDTAEVVKGVTGNAVYLKTGMGSAEIEHAPAPKFSLSIWRKWDGLATSDTEHPFFSLKNFRVFFGDRANRLTIQLGNNAPIVTDVYDSEGFFHWFFAYEQGKTLSVYRNAKKVAEVPAPDEPVDFSEPFILGGGNPHATFDEIGFYDEILEQIYINGLFQFISRDANTASVESFVAESIPLHTPRYLGTIKTAPDKQLVNIFMGQKTGFNEANVSDWVLVVEPIAGYKRGWCYRYNGQTWDILNPPEKYIPEYTACLKDQLELKDLFDGTDNQFFGTILCQYLGFNEAVGRSLTANQVFVDNLVAKKVLVDSDVNDPTDFELTINRDVGILAKNNGKKVFEVSPVGGVNAGAVQLLENGIGIKDGELFVENNGWRGTLRACENGVEFAIISEDAGGNMTKKQMQTVIRNGVLSLFVLGTITACENIYHGNTAAVTSPWVKKTSGTTRFLFGVACNSSTWVTVGRDGTILVSTDNGNTWTTKQSGTVRDLRGVACNGSVWVAVGDGGTILTSTDNGNTWTTKQSGAVRDLRGVACNGSIWVAVSKDIILASADNGNTWTQKASGEYGLEGLDSVACNGSVWVAASAEGTILVSADNGNTWTIKQSGVIGVPRAVACNGTTWVIAGGGGIILASTDNGNTWTTKQSGEYGLDSVACNGSVWVVAGAFGAILVSADNGNTWTTKRSGGSGQSLFGVAYSGNTWVAVGDGGTILTSTDIALW